MSPILCRGMAALVILGLAPALAQAQYSKITTPFHSVNDSFFERIGAGFGFNLAGGDPNGTGSRVIGLNPLGQPTPSGALQFRWPGLGATPTIGGYDPAGDATLGFRVEDGRGNAMMFNFAASQGSRRTFTTEAPSVVVPSGGQGWFSDTSQRPFVIGIVPVVGGLSFGPPGGYPPPMPTINPIAERYARLQQDRRQQEFEQALGLGGEPERGFAGGSSGAAPMRESTAVAGDLSVAEIQRMQAREQSAQDAELQQWIERGRGAEDAGKFGVAKIYYQMAARRAAGEVKEKLLEKVRQLETQP